MAAPGDDFQLSVRKAGEGSGGLLEGKSLVCLSPEEKRGTMNFRQAVEEIR
jgi:hypothetical protein